MHVRPHCMFSAALALITIASSSLHAEDWPRWGGPRGDATWQGPKLPEKWPEGGPRQVWSQPTGPGYSGIAATEGRIYTLDRPAAAPDTERVVCLDAADGRPLWSHSYRAAYGDLSYGKGPRSTPTVHEDRVYTLGAMGHLHCLDAETGAVIWSRDLAADSRAKLPEWGFAASPVIYQDTVIVHVAVQPGGCVSAYDLATGKERWRSGDDPAGYATPILIRHAGVEQMIVWSPEHILGMAPASGEIFWKQPYSVQYGVSIATPIFQEGMVFVSGYWHGSKAIRLADKSKETTLAYEENEFLRGLMAQPLYRDGHAYLLDKRFGLICFEFATGKKVWADDNRLTPRDRNPHASLVWLGDEDRAIALNSEGELVLLRLNPRGYHEDSRAKIIGLTWAHPAYMDRFVFARDDEKIVCCELTE